MASASLPTVYGDFQAVGYVSTLDGKHHLALVHGEALEGPNLRSQLGRKLQLQ